MSNETEIGITMRLRARVKPFTKHKVWRYHQRFKKLTASLTNANP